MSQNFRPGVINTSPSFFFIRDFLLILASGVLLLVLVVLPQHPIIVQPFRLLLSSFFVFFVPGYALTAALFPDRNDLDQVERIGLSLGLSVAWVPLLVLILDNLPWGLRLWPFLFGQLFSLVLFAAIATWRRIRLTDWRSEHIPAWWQPRAWWAGLNTLDKRLYQLYAAALLLAGLISAYIFLLPCEADSMTEFYMLGKDGLAEDFPRRAFVGEQAYVSIGITNRERSSQTYRLEAWAVDLWEEGRRALITEIGPVRLEVGETLEWPFFFSMPWSGKDQRVEFYLYRLEDKGPYRRLRLWIDVDARLSGQFPADEIKPATGYAPETSR
jgi:uncharacterized membrane protein